MVLRALNSILGQTYQDIEIIVVDDSPEDYALRESVKEAVLSKKTVRPETAIRYIPHEKNRGACAARNTGLMNAEGEYVAYLDDDDEWLRKKLEFQCEALKDHPDAALIFGIGKKVYEDGSPNELTWSASIYKENPSYIDMLTADHVGSASHPLILLEAVREVGGFRMKSQPAVEDYELWIRIARSYPIYGINRILYIKHMPAGEHVSGNHYRVFKGYQNIYKKNRKAYSRNPKAKERIFYNMLRRGVMAMTPEIIPVAVVWLFLRLIVPPEEIKP